MEDLSLSDNHRNKKILKIIANSINTISTTITTNSSNSSNIIATNDNNNPIIIVIGHNNNDVSEDITHIFHINFELSTGNLVNTATYLRNNTTSLFLSSDVCLNKLSNNARHFSIEDLNLMIEMAHLRSINRTLTLASDEIDLQHIDAVVVSEDFEFAMNHIEHLQERSLISLQSPNVSWTDIGGLDNIKQDIISSFTNLDVNNNVGILKRSGLLLYGPPGCGKTMLAKAIATEFKYSFINIKGPELLNLYVGQSEQNMRDLFDQAFKNAPCVIFFDEVDSIAPQRGHISDSGGVTDRVSAQLMIELDRVSSMSGVYVIAATNRYDMLDTALIRSGRFDKVLYVGGVSSEEQLESVLRVVIKNFTLGRSIDVPEIVALMLVKVKAGCDVYSICYEAMMISFRRKVKEISESQLTDQPENIIIEQQDFIEAISIF